MATTYLSAAPPGHSPNTDLQSELDNAASPSNKATNNNNNNNHHHSSTSSSSESRDGAGSGGTSAEREQLEVLSDHHVQSSQHQFPHQHHHMMNLVNGAAAAAAAAHHQAAAASGYHNRMSLSEMHETKYLPPAPQGPHHHHMHNGHPALAGAHNPWAVAGIPTGDSPAHWAMHPSLYPPSAAAAAQDLKQDIKPHSPGDFHNTARSSATTPSSTVAALTSHSWNPPPVSSPYLGMASAAASSSNSQGTGGGGNSPSPIGHHHTPYGMGGMIPGAGPMGGPPVQPISGHPFASAGIDRYGGPGGGAGSHHRDSHNSSPRSATDEDGMHTPTSGTSNASSSFFPDSAGTNLHYFATSFLYLSIVLF